MFYKVLDKKDDYCVTCFSKEEALTNAINHCVTEGLQVYDVTNEIENSFSIIYIDPDDNQPETIHIYAIEE